MKYTLSYLILFFGCIKLNAQNTKLDYKFALKIYNQSSFEQSSNKASVDTLNNNVQNANSTLQYIHPTIAFQWRTKKQNFREIELINFYVNKKTESLEQLDSNGNVDNVLSKRDVYSSGISMRYEYTVIFKKLKASNFVPSISYAASAYFNHDQFVPKSSNAFKNIQSTLGARGFIIPRLTYFVGSKLFVDLNVPICIMDLYYHVNENENPGIPLNQQRISNINFELFPKVISVRLGVGIKI
jgi:hypothetical protein